MTEELHTYYCKDCFKKQEQIDRLEQERDKLKKSCEKCKLFDIEKTNRDLLERIDELEQENKELKEKIIKLTEENGNLIINRNTVENKLRDTESRLISIQKANTHNLVLLQRRNNALEEIREIVNQSCDNCKYNKDDITCSIGDCGEGKLKIIENRINEVLSNDRN